MLQREGAPGAILENLDFGIQRSHWGGAMLNADASIVRFADVPFQQLPFFIRPVYDTKDFVGTLMDWGEFSTWRQRVLALSVDDNPTINRDTLVMIASPKEIWSETRLWIIDGRVITASGYKMGTRVLPAPPESVDPTIIKFAAEQASRWNPNRAYVCDVAETPNGLRIVEINNINSAGFYKGYMDRLVAAMIALAGQLGVPRSTTSLK
jgi:hypothetical protein